jgi:hypothetical protein
MRNTNIKKNEEVFFIASQYQNEPIQIDYFTKSKGTAVPEKLVIKKETDSGIKFYIGAQ